MRLETRISLIALLMVGISCQPKEKMTNGEALPTGFLTEDSAYAEPILEDSLQIEDVSDLARKPPFIPDTTINGKLMLENPKTFSSYLSDQPEITFIERFRVSPGLLFLNKSREEYLFAYFYEGNTRLAFSYFEIGASSNEENLTSLSYIQTEEESFRTESEIGLGIALEELTSMKGQGYSLETDSLSGIYEMGPETSFVKRFHMPGYEMKFFLEDGKISKILFGFTYP
ncbi:MAG: hypothetical protein AAF388_17270 [Bacteroidota bacterium]